jgi:hypothetical protein
LQAIIALANGCINDVKTSQPSDAAQRNIIPVSGQSRCPHAPC